MFIPQVGRGLRSAFITLIVLVCTPAAPPAAAQAPDRTILVDRGMTVAPGAALVTATAAAVAAAENAVVPVRLFEERGASRRTANIAYRLARLALFDVPQETVFVVANHEVFGHGARLRELFDGPIRYRVDPPPPYGSGGGSTTFRFDREPSVDELLAVTTAGMEASGAAASAISAGVVRRGYIDWREAMRYIGFETDTFFYIQSTGDDPEAPGHDVSDFRITYNEASRRLGQPALTARTLRREALVGLANPLLAFAAVGVGRYLWSGATRSAVPAFSLAGTRYLPMARYRLTPYGTEFAVVSELANASRASTVELRFGRAPGTTPWGVTASHQPIVRWRTWTFGAAVHAWRQPPFGSSAVKPELRSGAAVFARAQRAVPAAWFGSDSLAVVIETGTKSSGFVPGEPLGSGPVLRVGVALALDR